MLNFNVVYNNNSFTIDASGLDSTASITIISLKTKETVDLVIPNNTGSLIYTYLISDIFEELFLEGIYCITLKNTTQEITKTIYNFTSIYECIINSLLKTPLDNCGNILNDTSSSNCNNSATTCKTPNFISLNAQLEILILAIKEDQKEQFTLIYTQLLKYCNCTKVNYEFTTMLPDCDEIVEDNTNNYILEETGDFLLTESLQPFKLG